MLTVIPLLVIDHLQSLEMEPKSFTKVTPPPLPLVNWLIFTSGCKICPLKDSVVLMRA